MNGAYAFERSLKGSLDSYEVPYNSADWVQLEKRLDARTTSTWQASAGIYALFLGGAIAISTTVWYLMKDDPGTGDANSIALATEGNNDTDRSTAVEASFNAEPIDTAAEPVQVAGTTDEATTPVARIVPEKQMVNRSPAPKKDGGKPGGTGMPATGKNTDNDRNSEVRTLPIKPSVTEGCPGTTVEFEVENMPDEGIHLWNFGDGSFSNKPDPTHTFSKAGTFEVMLSHSSVGGGNIQNKPAADRIVIHEAPEASFHFRKDEEEDRVPSVQFENRSIGGNQYHWDFGDGGTSTIAHPNHVFKKKGTYQITLTTTNAKGCIDRTDRTIVIDNDYNLLAPTTFSPDGNGFEDTFIPEALKTLGAGFHMSIFDPVTGAILYETGDAQRPWNGRINNKGEFCSTGDYIWLVEMKDGELLGGTYTGNVSLLR